MAVVQTKQLLYQISELSHKLEEKIVEIQQKMICGPLKSLFPKLTVEQIHFELLRNGLFDPDEITDLQRTVNKLEELNIWDIVNEEFHRLRNLWQGPDIPIFIFPLTKYRPLIDGIEVKKNGVTYQGVLFLFVSTDLKQQEVKALFAHEYHHICRLTFLNKESSEIPLKDSLVIEGMAECAVEELYGEEWLSPWTKCITFDESLQIWKERFVPFLQLKDVKNHRTYLYGDGSEQYPRWIGYSIGYRIVQSYLKNLGPLPQHQLYKTPTDDIIVGSDFEVPL